MVGTLAELMVKTNPNMYRRYVISEKGKSVLYLRLQKAIRHDEERAAIPQKIGIGTVRDGLYFKPI